MRGVQRSEILGLARRGAWFRSLGDAEIEALVGAGRVETFRRRGVLFRQGERPDGCYVLLEGRVRLVRASVSGSNILLFVGAPGYWFGVATALGGIAATVTAEAATPVKVLRIPTPRMMGLLRGSEAIAAAFLRVTGQQVIRLVELIDVSRRGGAPERIAAHLLFIDREFRHYAPRPWADPLPLPINQTDLSAMSGLTRQTVNAVIRRLDREGAIITGTRWIAIRNAAALESLSGDAPVFRDETGRPEACSR